MRQALFVGHAALIAAIFALDAVGLARHRFARVAVAQHKAFVEQLDARVRQRRQHAGRAGGAVEHVLAALDREVAGTGKRDVAAFKRDRRLPGLQRDLLIGLDVDAVVDREYGNGLVGQDFQLSRMRLQRYGAVGGNRLDAAGVAKQAMRTGRHGRISVAGRHVQVRLRRPVQLLGGKQYGRAWRSPVDAGGRFHHDQRLAEFFHRLVGSQLALARAGLQCLLSAHAGLVFAILLGIDLLDQVQLGLFRVLAEQGGLLLRGLGQRLVQFGRAFQLGQRFRGVELGRGNACASLCAGCGRDEHAFAAAQYGPGVGAQFEAAAAVTAALRRVGSLLYQVTEVQLRGRAACRQAGAQLARRVVDHPLVIAAAIEIVAVDAGNHAGVIDVRIDAGRIGRRVAAGIELGHYQRTVHVAFDEVDQHFGADARRKLRTPVRAGQGFGNAHPGA